MNELVKDDYGNFLLRSECLVCGRDFVHTLPADYFTDNWHNFFECCTHNCLEYEYDYDCFKLNNDFKSVSYLYDWKQFVFDKALEINNNFLSVFDMYNIYNDIYESHKIELLFSDTGIEYSTIQKIAWG